jgi:hypothetical protein
MEIKKKQKSTAVLAASSEVFRSSLRGAKIFEAYLVPQKTPATTVL